MYTDVTECGFGEALAALEAGKRVARTGWNGKGMWLCLIPADQWGLGSGVPFDTGSVDSPHFRPWIGMRTADNCFVPWLASQTDLLAKDWCVC